MSIEYTIDIQLTELGFPDILQPGETSVRETSPSEDSFSPSHSPTALPPTHKQKLLVRGQQAVHGKDAAKQTSNPEPTTAVSASTLSEPLPCKPLNPAQSLQDKQAAKGTAPPELPVSAVSDPSAGPETAGVPRLIIKKEEDSGEKDVGDAAEAQQDVEDDSDDSEVSEVYEEEEVDEEEGDEDEEGLNTGTTLSL